MMTNLRLKSYWLMAIAFLMTGCSRAESTTSANRGNSIVTSCIDRVLLDMPSPIEFSGSEVKYDGTHSFAGIGDRGVRGVRYDGSALTETQPTVESEFFRIKRQAGTRITTQEQFTSEVFAIDGEIALFKDILKGPNLELRAEAVERLKELRERRASVEAARPHSGPVAIAEKTGFAFQDGTAFTLGFFVPEDKRVRIWEGKLTGRLQGAKEAIKEQYRLFRSRYVPRNPTTGVGQRGFCTAHGIILEKDVATERNTFTEVMFRSTKYPNLIFTLTVEPASAERRDIHTDRNLGADTANLHLIGIEKRFGPERVSMLGANGRVLGYSYGLNCSKTSCRPADQLYEFEAKTYGEAGKKYRPHLTLHMMAATSDEYKSAWPELPDAPDHNKVMRPGLKGKVPPPYEEGKKIFLQVLQSLRAKDPL